MKIRTREQFISSFGIKDLGLVEYIKGLENKGLEDKKILSTLLENDVIKTPITLHKKWKFYNSVRNQVSWI